MYNNPFAYAPYMASAMRPATTRGILAGIKAINWSGILSNTQKTLGIINQTIPIVYQVRPMINNAKTMFRIANTLKGSDAALNTSNNSSTSSEVSQSSYNRYEDSNRPIFFM